MALDPIIQSFLRDPRVYQAFLDAGWYPEREFDLTQWQQQYLEYGYVWNPIVETVLRSFGGLTVHPPTITPRVYAPSAILFDPGFVDFEISHESLLSDETLIQKALWPIGNYGEQGILFIDEEASIYLDGGTFLIDHGSMSTHAADALILAIRYPKLLRGRVWWQPNGVDGAMAPRAIETATVVDAHWASNKIQSMNKPAD
ncbi:SUKH-3 domain-containing protein [Herpetosiphon giganteus]|uniref:SUKH-3 domain-containing protein n=1 Tax=Herpetosiphon giganteus TaxID=2029754 RepID=UPI00195D9286|nr:SUKH-3 domain-containing protein [Herpetosiphon giganteus]MBM7841860.1 hypothetical protein [Herpetosiphon giganteus]